MSLECREENSLMRLHRTLGALTIGALLLGTAGTALAQDSTPDATPAGGLDAATRGQLAAITLDASSLPDGYTFSGETFLSADQLASGDLTADDISGAGFAGYYVSEYANTSDGTTIRSYASSWGAADAVQGGFDLLEDEAKTNPGASLTDGATEVGSDPREITTGTSNDPTDESVTLGVADVTFTVDKYLVGVSLQTSDGSEADTETVNSLAADLQKRAEGVVAGTAPEGTNLDLPGKVLDISGLGANLQEGFLSSGEAEQQLGLNGSALSGFSASWVEAVGLGEGDSLAPFVTVAVTEFGDDAAAQAVIDQAAELTPNLEGLEAVDGVEVEGATGVAALKFSSGAVQGSDVDSFRIVFATGSTLTVVDVQGAADAGAAQTAATELATAQASCAGDAAQCAVPTAPSSLAA
jgi:hypothetical protein